MEDKSRFELIAEQIGKIVTEKNKAYGNSFEESQQFLRILYPNGVPTESYGDMLCLIRIFDKLKRIATSKDAYGESPYSDLAGYAILGLHADQKKKKKLQLKSLDELDKNNEPYVRDLEKDPLMPCGDGKNTGIY